MAADVETEALRNAKTLCQAICTKTSLALLSEDKIPVRFKKDIAGMPSPGKENYIASLYAYLADHAQDGHNDFYNIQARAWWAAVALKGDAEAFYYLGALALNCDKDEATATIFMQAAAEKGNRHARIWLGLEKEDY